MFLANPTPLKEVMSLCPGRKTGIASRNTLLAITHTHTAACMHKIFSTTDLAWVQCSTLNWIGQSIVANQPRCHPSPTQTCGVQTHRIVVKGKRHNRSLVTQKTYFSAFLSFLDFVAFDLFPGRFDSWPFRPGSEDAGDFTCLWRQVYGSRGLGEDMGLEKHA